MKRRLLIIAAVLVLVLVGIVLWRFLAAGGAVSVVRPSRENVVELVVASGRLRAKRQSPVGSEIAGTVEGVYVDEGDEVTAGNLLIRLSRPDLEQQVRQAELAVTSARRELERVQSGALEADIAKARAQVSEARRVGQAQLEAAQERLKDLERGGLPEEVRRAQAQLRQAKANLDQAQTDLKRNQQLVAEGAIAEAELDRAETAVEVAQANVEAAQEQVQLAKQPASPEEIAAARAEVASANASLEESVRVAQESLRALESLPRVEEVRLAQSRLREAEAALQYARDEAAKRIIRAPLSGIVTKRDVEPGQSITPGEDLLTIADMSNTEIYVETDETNLPKLEVGQPATVIAPAFKNRPFKAYVSQIGPEVDTQRGVVGVRLKPIALPNYARPDMTVDVSIEVGRYPNALALPVEAVLTKDEQDYVLVVKNGVAERKDVTVLGRSDKWAALRGLSPDAKVVLQATEVEPGERVRVRGEE